jgi:hypothetical protein
MNPSVAVDGPKTRSGTTCSTVDRTICGRRFGSFASEQGPADSLERVVLRRIGMRDPDEFIDDDEHEGATGGLVRRELEDLAGLQRPASCESVEAGQRSTVGNGRHGEMTKAFGTVALESSDDHLAGRRDARKGSASKPLEGPSIELAAGADPRNPRLRKRLDLAPPGDLVGLAGESRLVKLAKTLDDRAERNPRRRDAAIAQLRAKHADQDSDRDGDQRSDDRGKARGGGTSR